MASSGENADDAELVRSANQGDEHAFEALYRRYRHWVVALAYRFLGDRDDALDVLQQVFIYFFGKFPGFELTGTIKGFLYPTVKHLCLSLIRKRRPTVDIDDVPELLPARGEAADPLLWRAIDALPATQREVLLLRYADDLSLAQIAETLDVPLGTVKSRLHHAVEALKKGFPDLFSH